MQLVLTSRWLQLSLPKAISSWSLLPLQQLEYLPRVAGFRISSLEVEPE